MSQKSAKSGKSGKRYHFSQGTENAAELLCGMPLQRFVVSLPLHNPIRLSMDRSKVTGKTKPFLIIHRFILMAKCTSRNSNHFSLFPKESLERIKGTLGRILLVLHEINHMSHKRTFPLRAIWVTYGREGRGGVKIRCFASLYFENISLTSKKSKKNFPEQWLKD